jgi:hypothetical protein
MTQEHGGHARITGLAIYDALGSRMHACWRFGPDRHFPHASALRSKIGSDSTDGGE